MRGAEREDIVEMVEHEHVEGTSRARPVLAVAAVAGILLIALPDPDARLFSFSDGHGPGILDAVGAALLSIVWIAIDVFTWHRREALRLSGAAWAAVAVVSLGASALLVWSISTDTGWWWLLGAGVLGLLQVGLAARAGLFRTGAR